MADRGLKPTATVGGRSATKDKSCHHGWRCAFCVNNVKSNVGQSGVSRE